nr:hypothetical protein [uncultured Sphingosinicella sp.]
MMRTFTGAAAALAMALAALSTGTALAQESAAESTTPAKAKVADKSGSRRVCRNLVVSGSRLSSRICRTQADWDKAMTDTQDAALQQQTGPGFRSEAESRGPSASALR